MFNFPQKRLLVILGYLEVLSGKLSRVQMRIGTQKEVVQLIAPANTHDQHFPPGTQGMCSITMVCRDHVLGD